MQEEVDNRTIALTVSTAKLTGRIFKAAVCQYLAYRKEKKIQKSKNGSVIPHGKQTVKQLIGQNQGVSTIESNDPDIKSFEKIARKYGVDYAIKKVKTEGKLKYVIFSRQGTLTLSRRRSPNTQESPLKKKNARPCLKSSTVSPKMRNIYGILQFCGRIHSRLSL